MICPLLFPRLRALWRLLEAPRQAPLLLALAFIRGGLEPGPGGLFRMEARAAAETAERLGARRWNLDDEATALRFAASWLSRRSALWGLPRIAVAGFVVGDEAVHAAGGQVPLDAPTARTVRDVMLVYGWLQAHLHEVLSGGQPPLIEVSEQPPLHRNGRLLRPVTAGVAMPSYAGASGLDVLAPYQTPVVAVDSGVVTLAYAPPTSSPLDVDTPGQILLQLDHPLRHGHGPLYPLVLCTNLSSLCCDADSLVGCHVLQGEVLGWSGTRGRLPCVRLTVFQQPGAGTFLPPPILAAYYGWQP